MLRSCAVGIGILGSQLMRAADCGGGHPVAPTVEDPGPLGMCVLVMKEMYIGIRQDIHPFL
jgi:hypothetical protein